MSNFLLMKWFDQLLFGHRRPDILEPPKEVYELICRLEADGIYWKDMIRHGGLTMFRYQTQGDLEKMLEYLDKVYLQDQPETPLPKFHTSTLTHFFNHLLTIMARRDQMQSNALAMGTEEDKSILETILSQPNTSSTFPYNSAQFWGELARNLINHRRPLPKELAPLSVLGNSNLHKTARLYDVTCQTQGKEINPLNMHMVPASEYVNSVHWESDTLLEAFLKTRPKHPLAQAVEKLVMRALNQFIAGQYPSCLKQQDSNITTFLENAKVIHDTVPKASFLSDSPPLVIDIFQRLLALAQLDELWRSVPCQKTVDQNATDLMRLTEQLHLADRQNRILLEHVSSY